MWLEDNFPHPHRPTGKSEEVHTYTGSEGDLSTNYLRQHIVTAEMSTVIGQGPRCHKGQVLVPENKRKGPRGGGGTASLLPLPFTAFLPQTHWTWPWSPRSHPTPGPKASCCSSIRPTFSTQIKRLTSYSDLETHSNLEGKGYQISPGRIIIYTTKKKKKQNP